MKMKPSGHVDLASTTSSPVKWKVRKLSSIRDFPKSFQPAQMHISNLSTDKSSDSVDVVMVINDQDIGSQEKVVDVGKAVLKPDVLESEEVKARVDFNPVEPVELGIELTLGSDDATDGYDENGPLRIGLYPPPKQRNVPVVRDFPLALKKFSEQVNQFENNIEDDIQSMESLMNDHTDCFLDHPEEESDMLESVPMVFEQLSGQADQEINGPLAYEDDVYEKEESLINADILGQKNNAFEVNDGLDSLFTYDQEVTEKKDGADLTGFRSNKALNIPRRRVSAVRCFPPGCGRNALRLSEEELKKAIAESKNHCLSCSSTKIEEPLVDEEIEQEDDDDFNVEEEEEIVDEVEEEEEGNEEMVEKQEEWDEVVVEEEEEEMVEDNFGITDHKGETMEAKVEGQREVVIALRASRFSSTENARANISAKRKSFANAEEEMVEKEEKEVMEEKEEAVMTDGKEEMTKAKLQGERMVVIALRASRCQSTENASAKQGEPRMVVQGLMASSQCIWRNNARKKVRK